MAYCPYPYLPRTTKAKPTQQTSHFQTCHTHLRSRSTRHTIRSLSPGGGATSPARGWNTPRQRAWRSASPSLVPSASTITVPRQLGSTRRRSLLGSMITGAPPGGGKIVNEERWTHRTTVWYAPSGLQCKFVDKGSESQTTKHLRFCSHGILKQL